MVGAESMAYLTTSSKNGAGGQEWHLDKPVIFIGRGETADVALVHPRISRQHASITCESGVYYLEDLSSSNGTFLNDKKISQKTALTHTDKIDFGGAITLSFLEPVATEKADLPDKIIGVWINPQTSEVWVDGIRLKEDLPTQLMDLLRFLYEHEGQVVPYHEIKAAVWQKQDLEYVFDETRKKAIQRLRKCLLDANPAYDYIEISRGYGVMLKRERS
ncbi:MAG: FHA domain-containing protein [Anaerolineae bacterium]|nr:FHA domain-containing protein [Anaerolineae bacterium]